LLSRLIVEPFLELAVLSAAAALIAELLLIAAATAKIRALAAIALALRRGVRRADESAQFIHVAAADKGALLLLLPAGQHRPGIAQIAKRIAGCRARSARRRITSAGESR
jgi:hypothetical protein